MPKPSKPTDYEDEPPTRVETPLRTRYDRETRQLLLEDEPPEPGVVRSADHDPTRDEPTIARRRGQLA